MSSAQTPVVGKHPKSVFGSKIKPDKKIFTFFWGQCLRYWHRQNIFTILCRAATNVSIFSGGEGERSALRPRYIGKRIMKLMGLDLGRNRTPFQNLTDAEEVAIKSELQAIGFFDRCNVL